MQASQPDALNQRTSSSSFEETCLQLVPIVGTYIALFSYPPPKHPGDPGCLPIQKGDVVHILEKHVSGWWEAYVKGKRGWVPSNYLGPLPSETNTINTNTTTTTTHTHTNSNTNTDTNTTMHPLITKKGGGFAAGFSSESGLEKLEQRLASPLLSSLPSSNSTHDFSRTFSNVSDFQRELAHPLLDFSGTAVTSSKVGSSSSSSSEHTFVTWEMLTQKILDPMTQLNEVTKVTPPDPLALVHHLNTVVNRIRSMLHSCRASKESMSDKNLKTMYHSLLSALGKFTLSGQIACGGWPPPDAIQTLRLRASHLLLHLRTFLSHARHLPLHPVDDTSIPAFDIGVVEVETFASFDSHLSTIATTFKSLPFPDPLTSLDSLDFNSWMSPLSIIVQQLGHLISLIDELPCLQEFPTSANNEPCFKQRDLLYTQTNDIVTAARTLVDAFRPPNALASLHQALQSACTSAQELVHLAKVAMGRDKKPELLVKVLDASKKKEQEMNVLQRRALSLSFDSLNNKLDEPSSSSSSSQGGDTSSRPTSISSSSTSSAPRVKSRDQVSEVAPLESFFQTNPISFQTPANPPELPDLPARMDFLGRDTPVHDILFSKEGKVVSGTFSALIEQLTTHDVPVDRSFLTAFFRTFRMFATPNDVCSLLIQRFLLKMPSKLNALDMEVWKEKKQTPIRLRVFNALKLWLDQYFYAHTDLCILDTLTHFAEQTLNEVMPQASKRILELIEKLKKRGLTTPSLLSTASNKGSLGGGPVPAPSSSSSSSSSSTSLSTSSLSLSSSFSTLTINWQSENDLQIFTEQITLFEFQLFQSIKDLDLVHWISVRDVSQSPVRAMVQFATQCSSFICSSILNEQDVKKRSQILKFWIKVAEKCLTIQNYNSLRAVLSAIDSSTIARLNKTWDLLSEKTHSILPPLRQTIDPSRNSAVYREKLKCNLPPCIPFLGLCLTDLTFIQEGTKNQRDQLINFDKYMKISQCITELLRFQSPYSFKERPDWQHFIKTKIAGVSDTSSADQEQLYRMSLIVEPRASQTYAT
ncbi:hypothetical protein HMI55_004141 [Coelomomyces lativittatus]|nr:hypothetical protein HMI55_004141 [Coelomomyces lativittatus]